MGGADVLGVGGLGGAEGGEEGGGGGEGEGVGGERHFGGSIVLIVFLG